jgi:hypothetical protein
MINTIMILISILSIFLFIGIKLISFLTRKRLVESFENFFVDFILKVDVKNFQKNDLKTLERYRKEIHKNLSKLPFDQLQKDEMIKYKVIQTYKVLNEVKKHLHLRSKNNSSTYSQATITGSLEFNY